MIPEIFTKFTEIGVSIDFFLYDQMSSLFSNCFPSNTLLRLWDLIFLDFSSPVNEGVSKGLGYIVSTCLYLLKVNEKQILISNTPEELSVALHNSCSTKFDTEEIIENIYELNENNFAAGSWFSRRLESINKTFGNAASYLDNARISFEEDLDLVFDKTIRENRAVWDLLHSAGEEEPLDYNDWCTEKNSILPKFKRKFGQIPSTLFTSTTTGSPKDGNLEFDDIYIFVYSLFDNQIDINSKIEFSLEYSGSEMDSFQLKRYDKMTVVDHSFKLEYNDHVNTVNIVIYEDDKQYGIYQLDLNAFKSDQIYKLWIDVISEKDNEQDLEFEIGVL